MDPLVTQHLLRDRGSSLLRSALALAKAALASSCGLGSLSGRGGEGQESVPQLRKGPLRLTPKG